jgi:hypothetical protein
MEAAGVVHGVVTVVGVTTTDIGMDITTDIGMDITKV